MKTPTDIMSAEQGSIRVLSVDDHDLLRDGIRISLLTSTGIELVGEARTGEDALRLCDKLDPDVVLMDVQLPRMNGVEATRSIRDAHPTIQVIVYTSFVEDSLVQEAIQAGAVGYLSKASSRGELTDAIRAAHAGQTTLSNEAMQALFRATKSTQEIGVDLTIRQRDVLRELVAKVDPNVKTADRRRHGRYSALEIGERWRSASRRGCTYVGAGGRRGPSGRGGATSRWPSCSKPHSEDYQPRLRD